MRLYFPYHIYNAHKDQVHKISNLEEDFFQQEFLDPFHSCGPNAYAKNLVRFLILQQPRTFDFLVVALNVYCVLVLNPLAMTNAPLLILGTLSKASGATFII